ncbi:MAG: LPXTG cell wall anchor domain-containing protein [Micromonosporaceae bacterium]|nr:LPXTG cell wall anchor domain-containing protein [Micromonosporaceae bacterium]
MRATVRAAGIAGKRKTRTGIVATRVGALALATGVVALSGAFFAGPAAAGDEGSAVQLELLGQPAQLPAEDPESEDPGAQDEGDDGTPPVDCDQVPAPPFCDEEPTDPPPSDDPTDPPEPTGDPTKTKTPKPSNVVTRPGNPGNGGGNGAGNQGGGNSGGGGELPKTGLEVGLLAGTGAALIGGGATLVLMARRRKAAAFAGEAEVSEGVEKSDDE